MADDSLKELDRFTRELMRLLEQFREGSIQWHVVSDYCVRFNWLTEDTLVASQLLGMMTPWQPDQPPLTRDLSIGAIADYFFGPPNKPDDDKWRWPQLQKAVNWLRSRSIVTYDELKSMVNVAKQTVGLFSGTLNDKTEISKLQSAVAESINDGDSLQDFRARIKGVVEIPRKETETIFRTNTKRAFIAGQDRILKNPQVKKVMKYVRYRATSDARTRPWHAALNNMIAEVDSPLHDLFRSVQSEYNCRCALIPLAERQLDGRPVSDVADVPLDVKARYGV